jgi:hypothetical protein
MRALKPAGGTIAMCTVVSMVSGVMLMCSIESVCHVTLKISFDSTGKTLEVASQVTVWNNMT